MNYTISKVAEFTGIAGPGTINIGVGKAGDKLISIQSSTYGSPTANFLNFFSEYLTVDTHIHQHSGADLSSDKFIVLIATPNE